MLSSHAELLMRFQLALIVIFLIELNTDKLSQKIIYGHVLPCDITAAKWAFKCDYSIGIIHNLISLKTCLVR